MAGAEPADVEHRLAHGREQRPHPLEVGGRAADHEHQLGRLRRPTPRRRPAHRPWRRRGRRAPPPSPRSARARTTRCRAAARRARSLAAGPRSPPTSERTTSPFGTIVTTMSLRRGERAGDAAADGVRQRRRRGSAATPGATSNSCSGWPARARCEAIGRPMTPRPMKPTRGGDADAFIEGLRGSTKGGRKRQATRRAAAGPNAGPLARYCPIPRSRRWRTLVMASPRFLAACAAALLLGLGPVAASAQTTLTMSSWVGPTHSLTRDVLGGVGRIGREGDQRPGQVPDAAQASLGAARHLRRGARRPGRRLLRHRQLHAGAPSAAADRRAARRRRHRRDQLGRVLAHPLEVLAAGQRIQGREAARRVHPRPGPDVPGQEAGDHASPISPA